MKKCLAICSTLALVSASQAAVIFQENFSGYDASGGAVALNSTAQVGTWTKSVTGSIDVQEHALLDGSTGPCLVYYEDVINQGASLMAEAIAYSASPIKITYDFRLRRLGAGGIDAQKAAVFAVQTDGDYATYTKVQKANSAADWISDLAGNNEHANTLVSKDLWYTMVMELPVMPASGAFTYKWTIYDATGNIAVDLNGGPSTKADQVSWSADAGAQLIDRILFTAPGVSDVTSILIDNILIETDIEPTTIWILGWRGNHPSVFQNACFSPIGERMPPRLYSGVTSTVWAGVLQEMPCENPALMPL